MVNTDIQLTPAELEMIKLKREQLELKKKEDELRKQAEIEKEIAAAKKRRDEKIAECERQVAQCTGFFKEFPVGYRLVINETQDRARATMWNSETRKPDEIWSEEFKYRNAHIEYGQYKVYVEYVYTRKSYTTYGEWKMSIGGPDLEPGDYNRNYTRWKTVVEKITAALNRAAAAEQLEARKKDAVQSTVDKMKELYPTATLITGTGGERNPYNRKQEWISYPTIDVHFDNGIKIKYRIYPDGSLGRKDITFPAKDAWHLMDAMSKISFPEIKE